MQLIMILQGMVVRIKSLAMSPNLGRKLSNFPVHVRLSAANV